MNYTQAQIDRANAVSLEDFLRTQGETLIKSGREYRWKEHDSLTVRGNKWFRHSQSKGGYPIGKVLSRSRPAPDRRKRRGAERSQHSTAHSVSLALAQQNSRQSNSISLRKPRSQQNAC